MVDLLITALLVAAYGALLLFLGWMLGQRQVRLLWASHRELVAFQDWQCRRHQELQGRVSRLEAGRILRGCVEPQGFSAQQAGSVLAGPGSAPGGC